MCAALGIIWFLTSLFMFSLMALVFWFWMLIDLLKRDTKDKLVWVLVFIFLNVIGAVLYYFLVYAEKQRKKRKK
ncbi:MAG: PLDc_N domain-containing protein [archaeon]|nr:MAG: PLDc_N domain-containing protein [archaeon]